MTYQPAAVALLLAIGGPVMLHNSNVSFKHALEACPGGLGAVSFSLNHARISAMPGTETDESGPDSSGVITVKLQSVSGGKSAQISIDQERRWVSAKNLRTEMNGRVACILPD